MREITLKIVKRKTSVPRSVIKAAVAKAYGIDQVVDGTKKEIKKQARVAAK